MIGEEGIEHELKSVGIQYAGGTVRRTNSRSPRRQTTEISACHMNRTPRTGSLSPLVITPASRKTPLSEPFSVVSTHTSVSHMLAACSDMRLILDSRPIDYKKYAKAHTYIMNNPGCEFILTNADATYPAGGSFYPGTYPPSHSRDFAFRKVYHIPCLDRARAH